LYATAAYVLLDSRFLARLLHATRGLELPVCTGSDLTATLFAKVISADDALVLIGGTPAQAAQLVEQYGLRQLAHLNPPMGFIGDPVAVEACLRFIEANSPFRFCLLALGSPQQEIIAQRLKARGIACGLALCVGASIDFLTGSEQRAPDWMQRASLEWLFRLVQDPRRMAWRYLVRGPRVFSLLRRTRIVLRPAALPRAVRRATTSLLVPVQTGERASDDTSRHGSPSTASAAAKITFLDLGSRRSTPDIGTPDNTGLPRPGERAVRLRGRERERSQPGAG
jgi:exopolysaccharide biosynthesis WecB/TagA/CpsF family protein